MSLFRSTLRPPAILSDEAIERYVHAIRAEIEPDPLFRRRLRGEVVNRHVAVREGIAAHGGRTAARSMGRIGRAVLYASFTLAISVTSVMAASQDAIPGDLLYPLKRQVEELRVRVLPAHLHDELALIALSERIGELGVLADRGEWLLMVEVAEAVERDYVAFVQTHPDGSDGSMSRQVVVLNALLERLPVTARTAVEGVLSGLPGIGQTSEPKPARGTPPEDPGEPTRSNGGGGANGPGTAASTPDPTPAPTAQPTARPTRQPRPEPTPASPRPTRPADSNPEPKPSKSPAAGPDSPGNSD